MRLLTGIILIIPFFTMGQYPDDWYHLDPETDGYLGISSYKAHDFLKEKKSQQVTVAIIDNGIELTHEDLEKNLWVNEGEIPDNGIDDDKNGYIDDLHGWNFLGNSKGENLKYETLVLTRYYRYLKEKYGDKQKKDIPKTDREAFNTYQKLKLEYEKKVEEYESNMGLYSNVISSYEEAEEILISYMNDSVFTRDQLMNINTPDKSVMWARDFMLWVKINAINLDVLVSKHKEIEGKLNKRFNLEFDPRKELVGDDPSDITDTVYGNHNVGAKGPYHGTGVAGVVGAIDNDYGITGIAKNVKLMILRVVPNGDERDKDVALAMRYAVRNGADIINCSFAKDYMMHPEFIYAAMKEAEKADVLIVHAAGNESRNTDKEPAFPNGFYEDGTKAPNWLNVGSSNPRDTSNMISYYSNYGKKSVDIFAPGFQIKTTVLENSYEFTSGTSAAAPVVAGMAAVLKSYYPHLSAPQIRNLILESSYIPDTKKVIVPGAEGKTRKLKSISLAGGIANLYGAVQLAEEFDSQ